MDQRSLVERARAGDHDAFSVLARSTIGRLDAAGRQRFHEEQMLAAEMVRIPRDRVPPTVAGLRAHLRAQRPRDAHRGRLGRVGEPPTRLYRALSTPTVTLLDDPRPDPSAGISDKNEISTPLLTPVLRIASRTSSCSS